MTKLTKTSRARLEILAAFMRTVPKKRFNIHSWTTGGFCGVNETPEPKHNECGTAACVGGWACAIPTFQKAGLKLSNYNIEDEGNPIYEPLFKDLDGFDALESFFGLDMFHEFTVPAKFVKNSDWVEGQEITAGQFLFDSDNSNDPIKAAERIEWLIKYMDLYA